jgi:adenylate cyclase
VAATISQFEVMRQLQETRVERWLFGVRQTVLGSITILTLINAVTPISPIPNPPAALPVLLVLNSASLLLALVLWRVTTYWPARKYLFAAFEVILPQSALVLFGAAAPPLVLSAFALGLALAAIVLASLRYAVGVVITTGVLAAFSQVVIALVLPSPYGVVAGSIAVMLCIVVTFSAAYGTTSVVALHQQAVLQAQLARFLAPELVTELLANPALLTQQTRACVATVLFADIRGFTALSEYLSPHDVVTFLNLFLTEMAAAITAHRGMVDKYIGDAIMGVFGATGDPTAHAARALQAAQAMQARLVGLNAQLRTRNLPPLELGIGIHTGELVVGAVGSNARLDFTVIGDTVNLASRIEALTRQYAMPILLSTETRDALDTRTMLREIETIVVKNRRQPVTVWAVDAPAPGAK